VTIRAVVVKLSTGLDTSKQSSLTLFHVI
jgi:hypothetical protein